MFCEEVEFQETPIGQIPRTWEAVSLEDVILDIADGGTPSTKIKEYFNGDVPWVNIEDIKKDIYNTRRMLSDLGLKHSSAKLWNAGTVIFSFGASIGKVGIARVDLCTKQGIAGIVPRTDRISTEFLYYILLKNGEKIERIGRSMGSTIREVRPPKLKKLVVFPLPPVGEQKKIVEILSVVDLVIEKTDEVVAKTERLKKGLMQELLTKGIRHKEYKQTPIGKIPKAWDIVRLGDVARVNVGYVGPISEFYTDEDSGVPLLSTTNVTENGIRLEDMKYVTHEFHERNKKSQVAPGVVLIARHGVSGSASVVPEGLKKAQCLNVVIVRPNERIRSKFAEYLFNFRSNRERLLGWKSGSVQGVVNTKVLERFIIPVPPVDEQQRIMEILSTVDKKLDLEKREKSRLERSKRGLMDLLLTGKIRVKAD